MTRQINLKRRKLITMRSIFSTPKQLLSRKRNKKRKRSEMRTTEK